MAYERVKSIEQITPPALPDSAVTPTNNGVAVGLVVHHDMLVKIRDSIVTRVRGISKKDLD